MLAYTARPSSTALTMLAKLSSSSTMSAASRATSVPPMPMAMPMSARLSAGASLTPSPVTATTWPLRCNASTTSSFWSAVTRANSTSGASRANCSWLSERWRRSSPLITRGAAPVTRPISRAMALAVTGWSPVSMITWMPAPRQRRIASGTSARGGSSMPTRPAWISSLSSSMRSASPSTRRQASASTRRPRAAMSSWAWRRRSRCASSSGCTPSAVSAWLHSGSSTSGAPLQ
ncbi:hypothetical protein D3C78_841160 [compost metagenome]